MTDHVVATGYALRLLGGASLERDGVAQTGSATQRHRMALLAMLAAAYPRGLSRDKLIGCLWPERDAEAARNLLKQSVHVIRRSLGDHVILSAGEELRLGPDAIQCDLLDFERALERQDLERAIRLHTGPFLDGFFLSDAPGFEQWAEEQRQRLRLGYRRALEGLAAAAEADWPAAVEWLRRLLADDPCNAAVTMRLMHALDRSGDRTGAIRQARVHALLIEQEIGAGPDPNVVALAESLQAAPPSVGVPIDTGPVSSPVPPTSQSGVARETGTSSRWKRAARSLIVIGSLVLAAGWIWAKSPTGPGGRIQRIAVLPLDNLSGDSTQDYFAAGMHDALIAELGRIEALTVLSRQSVLRYAGSHAPLPSIARELGADALIEGSVLRSGDSVRVTVQLIRARPEEHLLASTHHGPVRQTLALQAEVAREIAKAVRVRVSPAEQTRLRRELNVDPVAQQQYLTGLYHLGRFQQFIGPAADQTIWTAIEALEQATTLAPGWAAAHAQLALAYHFRASSGGGRYEAEFFPKARAEALRALELDDTESQAHASLGFVLFRYEWDWAGAERAIRRALELDPNAHHWTAALYYQAAGRHQEAIDHFHQAEARNPLVERLKLQVISAYDCAGRQDEAIAQARELHHRIAPTGRRGVPGDSIWFFDFISRQYALKGDHARSIAAAEQLLAITDSMDAGPTLILAYALAGRRELARALLDKQEAYARSLGRTWRPAQLYAAVGDTERALDMALEARGNSRNGLTVGRCTLTYRLLQDQPRMQAMVRRVGFPD